MPEGESILGSLKNGLKVIVEDGVAKLTDRSAFAGSIATANCLVRNMVTMADVSLIQAVEMATATPAKIMKIENKKGTLAAGMDADIIVFDKDINIEITIVNGRVVYRKNVS
jgi:N-acetylglucosamine-6-phosphate deacetylase